MTRWCRAGDFAAGETIHPAGEGFRRRAGRISQKVPVEFRAAGIRWCGAHTNPRRIDGVILLYCLAAPGMPPPLTIPARGFLNITNCLHWLPRSLDSHRTWSAFWMYLGLAGSFWGSGTGCWA